MKFLSSTTVLFTALLLFSGCSKPTKPADVAKAFLTELAEGDLNDAKEYAAPETLKLLEFAEKFGQLPKHDNFVFNLVEEKIEGDIATVVYTNAKGKNKPIRLKKIDGIWKIDEKKQ